MPGVLEGCDVTRVFAPALRGRVRSAPSSGALEHTRAHCDNCVDSVSPFSSQNPMSIPRYIVGGVVRVSLD